MILLTSNKDLHSFHLRKTCNEKNENYCCTIIDYMLLFRYKVHDIVTFCSEIAILSSAQTVPVLKAINCWSDSSDSCLKLTVNHLYDRQMDICQHLRGLTVFLCYLLRDEAE